MGLGQKRAFRVRGDSIELRQGRLDIAFGGMEISYRRVGNAKMLPSIAWQRQKGRCRITPSV